MRAVIVSAVAAGCFCTPIPTALACMVCVMACMAWVLACCPCKICCSRVSSPSY